MFKKTNNNRQGFTLIELLVVMGILAVLLAAVLIAINPARQFAQSRDSQRRNDVLAILNAIQQNAADNKGQLPAGIPVDPLPPAVISDTGANLCDALMPKYISALPKDPSLSGPAITVCSAYSTGYTVVQDANKRVIVAAPQKEIATDAISVMR